MKKTLFIGSIVLDMIVKVEHLPKMKEDINTDNIKFSIGGCAYNANSIVNHFNLPAISCSPIGSGIFANILLGLLEKENKKPWIKLEGIDNGCCICLVNKDGERTFLSHHGAEYSFNQEWLKNVNDQDLDFIYVCGLEIEDENGEEILDYISKSKAKIFFAPGSRIKSIQHDRMTRILNLHPIVHLNEDEVLEFTQSDNVRRGAEIIHEITNELVIVTCGERGAYYTDGKTSNLVSGYKSKVKDTIGAGDSHAGACIAGLKMNLNYEKMLSIANKVASKVVSVEGAILTDQEFKDAIK